MRLPLKAHIGGLGFLLDVQVAVVARSVFYQVMMVCYLHPFLEGKDLVVTHTPIISRLYVKLPQKTVQQLQLVQNAGALRFTRASKIDCITPILRELH